VPQRRGDAISIPGDYQLRASQSPNAVQRFWHAAKKLAINQMLPPEGGDHILDAGCGSGVIADYLAASGADVTAIDANPEAIRFATSAFRRPNLRFLTGFIDDDLRVDTPLDKIYSLEVIEHMYEPDGAAMLQNFLELLRPGGRVLLTTPNYRSLWPLLEWTLDLFGMVPTLDEEQHVAHYHRSSLRRAAEQAGFKVLSIRSVCFLSPWIAPLSWRLATATAKRELKSPLALGCILVAVLEKPASL
jgi:2-polyprenyl-3-methyl-5-hydroxy-6-metoxy-1,4-benzoquinol methylase